VAPGAPLSRSLDQRCSWSGAAGPSGPACCCSLRALSCSPPSMRGHNAGWPASGNARGGPPDGSEFVVRLTAGQVGPEVPLTAVRGLTSAPDPERRRRGWLDADPQAPGRAGAFAVEAVAPGGPVSLVDDAGRIAANWWPAPSATPTPGRADRRRRRRLGPRRRREPPWQRQGRLLRAARGLDRRLTWPAPRPMRRAGRPPRGPSRRR
jgi:hypothetical protein